MLHAFDPVFVWERLGTRRAIGDVLRAAEWLTEQWPADYRGSDLHVQAMELCLLELEGGARPDEVRAMFVEAAFEAEILALDIRPTFSWAP
ncbi:MAG: DUF982 domain-containing protein [Candidatus Kaistia colombiensis]|nr:MAG: DUF982 domain-containing protein [Kaistia sp.]